MKRRLIWPLVALAVIGCGGKYHSGTEIATTGTASTGTTSTDTTGTGTTIGTTTSSTGTTGTTGGGGGTVNGRRVVAVDRSDHLVTFDTGNPSTLLTQVTLTGLDSGDTISAIDVRPSNGALYGVGFYGTLYKLNVASGVATRIGATNPQTRLAEDIDFDPTSDTLRVVYNTSANTIPNNANLRINPDTGALVATDTPFTYQGALTPGLPGLAYSPTGALYGIDNQGQLLIVPTPSSGVLQTYTSAPTTPVYGYGLDISSDGTTAITGGDDVDFNTSSFALVDVATSTVLTSFTLTGQNIVSVAFLD